jgi:alpha-glutamyl/putrescinyl thymine pyrophosphorylase clade 1
MTLLRRRARPATTIVFETYWTFAVRRQQVFFARVAGASPPWTSDPIIDRYRFTNAYRVLDRVSQYLVSQVIPVGGDAFEEIFFRVVLFKLFNKIETWQLLCREVGWPTWAEYRFERYDQSLSAAMARGERLYSAAYIMPSATRWGEHRKHRNHLRLLESMMHDRLPERIANASSMATAFTALREQHSIGDFLAYQLVTDLNYSPLCNFDEMEFVMPGPGARDGIAKCFRSLGDMSEPDVIRWVADTQEEQFAARSLSFPDLWGRPLQLIDCQNLFCEVDKYARLAHPEIHGRSGRTRIKQQFRPAGPISIPVLPAKWGIQTTANAEEGHSPGRNQPEDRQARSLTALSKGR